MKILKITELTFFVFVLKTLKTCRSRIFFGINMKWIAISGCDSGFGAIMVEKIKAMEGVGIFAGCFLQDTVRTLNSEQRDDVKAIILDVTNETSVLSFAATITEHLGSSGQLAGLVNNAGILINPGPTEWTPLHTYKKMFDVNVLGTVSLTKACLPLIRASQGRIVNVASIAGRTGLPSEPAYCASKYAVEGYSDVLRRDMLAWGVTVHIIEPGIFPNTGLYDRFQTGLDDLWNDLSPELQAEYGESYYQNFRERIGKSLGLGNSDSSLVPTAMLDALFNDLLSESVYSSIRCAASTGDESPKRSAALGALNDIVFLSELFV